MKEATWIPTHSDDIRRAVLMRLSSAAAPVSGEELSTAVQAGRNTVWKCIESLRALGYHIEGTTNRGYQLQAKPDTPYAWEVPLGLATQHLGQTCVYKTATTSTNDDARQLAKAGAPHGTVVVADTQTAGRGRRGRTWVSPAGTGLWLSVVLRPQLPPSGLALFPLLAGAAVAGAIGAETGLAAKLKWPNDVLVHSKKVCGILLELSAEAELVHYLVLGIGINVNMQASDFPPELAASATSLQTVLGRPQLRVPLLRQLLQQLEQRYHQLLLEGPEHLLREVAAISATLGQAVDVHGSAGVEFSGIATSINNDGALWVRDSAGTERAVYAGDVSIRNSVTANAEKNRC